MTRPDGTRVNVEMQLTDPDRTWVRAPFYWARIHTDQLTRGKSHHELKQTIVIFIVNYVQFSFLAQAHHIFELRHRDVPELRHPHMRIDFVELPKLPLTLPGDVGLPASHRLTIWGKFFRDPSDKTLEEAFMSDPVLKAAKDKLTQISRDQKNRERARQAEKNRLAQADRESLRNMSLEELRAEAAELARAQGEALGRAEGKALGRAEGEALGRAEGEALGRAEAIDKVLHSILTAEVTSGLSDEAIANLVGCSVDVVTAARRALSGD